MKRAFRLAFEIEVEGEELTVRQALTGAGLSIAADPDRFVVRSERTYYQIAERVQRPSDEEAGQ
jgi:hypothetical protein